MSADGADKTLDQYFHDAKYILNPSFGLEVIRF